MTEAAISNIGRISFRRFGVNRSATAPVFLTQQGVRELQLGRANLNRFW
jgi:hypothetical protein